MMPLRHGGDQEQWGQKWRVRVQKNCILGACEHLPSVQSGCLVPQTLGSGCNSRGDKSWVGTKYEVIMWSLLKKLEMIESMTKEWE